MIFAKVAEAEAVQMALVRWVAKRAEVRVMRGFDAHLAARAHQAVKLLHGADDVVDVLDYVNAGQAVEGVGSERVGKAVQIGQHVGVAGGIAVEPDGSSLLMNPAADIEDAERCRGPNH